MAAKAIPTEYAGYRFRSRLEARWAVFFDRLRVRWTYEAEGLDLDELRYLPDFYLPDSTTFVEVKGVMTERDEDKLLALARARTDTWVMVVGDIPRPGTPGPHHHLLSADPVTRTWIACQTAEWILSDHGQFLYPWPHGWPFWAFPDHRKLPDKWLAPGEARTVCCPAIDDAYRAARSAQFEFGQQGATLAPEMVH